MGPQGGVQAACSAPAGTRNLFLKWVFYLCGVANPSTTTSATMAPSSTIGGTVAARVRGRGCEKVGVEVVVQCLGGPLKIKS